MASGEVLRLIGTYKALDLRCRPSELLGIDDEYTAFCFDEAVALIITRLRNGEEPIMKATHKTEVKKPSDVYRKFSGQ